MWFFQGKTFSIRITVVSMFLGLAALTASIAIGLQYYFSYGLAQQASEALFYQVSEKVSERIEALDRESIELATLLNEFPNIGSPIALKGLHPATQAMAQSMRLNHNVYAIYVGYQNGDFYELINLVNHPDKFGGEFI